MGNPNLRTILSASKSVNDAALRLNKWRTYSRPTVPRRGAFALKSEQFAVKWYNKIVDMYLDHIEKLGAEYHSLFIFESYQRTQKGPVGPISNKEFASMTYKLYPLLKESDALVSREVIDKTFDKLYKHFSSKGKFSVKNINYSEEWKTLPNTTIRGFPYMLVGSKVDDKIISEAGNNYEGALAYFKKMNSLVTFPGLRFQGKPVKQGAKVRVINIPSTYYQYINVGIYHASMKVLKEYNSFVGWFDHNIMFNKIAKMHDWMTQNDYVWISLDFSKFDTTVSPYYREKANLFLSQICDATSEYFQHWKKLNSNQLMVSLNELGNLSLYPVNYQLLSGVINTQQDGSLVNLFVQLYVADKLGYDLPLDCALALGDDVGLPVPRSLLESFGYNGLLTKIKEIVKTLGLITHDKKAYPVPGLIFLQRLYDQPNGVWGHGSIVRNLASFIWPEKFPIKIKGVKNMFALHLISQIAIMSVPISKSRLNAYSFMKTIAKEWLSIDPYLNYIAWKVKSRNGTGHMLVQTLINLVGDLNYIKEFLDVQSYDHTGLNEKLNAINYGDVFPISNDLVKYSFESGLQSMPEIFPLHSDLIEQE